MVKCEIVNAIIKGFGGTNEALVDKRRSPKNFNPESLVQTCIAHLKQNTYPVEHLQIPLATEHLLKLVDEWHAQATVKTTASIPPKEHSTETRTMDFFSYPTHNEERNELDFKTFDFTHILTNLRTQILTRGLDYCRKEHFEHLSENRPDILSLALVVDKIDQQNVFTAMRMFNYNVEKYMRDNSFEETAEFVRLVRNWHDACNRRGLSADEQVSKLFDMHNFLTRGINFNCVPFQFPGWYVKGLTWQTYEAILQMISTRIQLYSFAHYGTYNSRAVSTLANESFFADLVRYDKESHGYPKGPNVSQVFGRVVLLNHFKHKGDKNYRLSATIKGKYEIKLADDHEHRCALETALNYDGLYRNHFFDYPNVLKSH